ncbi:MAG: hypothetical protein BWY63_03429 [Chloroflexi bacterium ADurb.Bin360]|nr:MAG: hypothetical protein BWY63_03429 [Chloroflexi bacterium ADurb.Bin360]
MPGDIGQTEGIYSDHVIARSGLREKSTPIHLCSVQIRLRHAEIIPPYPRDCRVNLHAIDGNRAIERCILFGNCACRRAYDQETPHLFWCVRRRVEVGGDEEEIPGPTREECLRIVHGMNSLTFVEEQKTCALLTFQYLDVIVGGLFFVNQARLGLDGTRLGKGERQNR